MDKIPTAEEISKVIEAGNIAGAKASQVTGVKYTPITLLSTDEAKTNLQKELNQLNKTSPTTDPNHIPPEIKNKPADKISYVDPQTEQETEFTPEQLKDQKYIDYIKNQGLKRISGAVPDFELTDTGVSTEEKEVKDLNTRIEGLANSLATYNVDADPSFQAQAQSIRNQYTELKNQMVKINYQRQQSMQTLGFRLGGQQYAGAIWKGIEGEEVTQGNARLADLASKEADAISSARTAYRDGKWKEFSVQMDALESVRNFKSKELEKMNSNLAEIMKEARKEEGELKKRNKLVEQSQAIGIARDAGYTTNEDVYSFLAGEGYDITGEEVGKVNDILNKKDKVPELPADIKSFKAFYPDVDITTPEGRNQFLDWQAVNAAATRKPETAPKPKASDLGFTNAEIGRLKSAGIPEDIYTNITKLLLGGIELDEIRNILTEAGEDSTLLDKYDRAVGIENVRGVPGSKEEKPKHTALSKETKKEIVDVVKNLKNEDYSRNESEQEMITAYEDKLSDEIIQEILDEVYE